MIFKTLLAAGAIAPPVAAHAADDSGSWVLIILDNPTASDIRNQVPLHALIDAGRFISEAECVHEKGRMQVVLDAGGHTDKRLWCAYVPGVK
jgi:hypothetical protein